MVTSIFVALMSNQAERTSSSPLAVPFRSTSMPLSSSEKDNSLISMYSRLPRIFIPSTMRAVFFPFLPGRKRARLPQSILEPAISAVRTESFRLTRGRSRLLEPSVAERPETSARPFPPLMLAAESCSE